MIVGTAGHIDHGKTTLVRALTGVDADRLPEEKARGLTIDLGYAYTTLPCGARIGFVDVPGHEKFIRNMLAGATGIDCAILVVAADDGVMPQTREHLAILDLVGISRGLVALTKTDRADAGRLSLVADELHALLAATALSDLDILPCSTATGEGVEAIRDRLSELAAEPPRHAEGGAFRLAVDRSFIRAGAGTVVTGTVYAGTVKPGDRVTISPAGVAARVRAVRSQDEDSDSGGVGQRCALNLVGPGIGKDAIQRGDWVLAPHLHAPTARLGVRLKLLPDAPPLEQWASAQLHLAAAYANARVSLMEGDTLAPGESGIALISLDRSIGALHGDRFVIRDPSGRHTLGGGIVLDPFAPARGRRRIEAARRLATQDQAAPERALQGLMAASPAGVDLASFAVAWNLTPEAIQSVAESTCAGRLAHGAQTLVFAPARFADLEDSALQALSAYHRAHPDSPGPTIDELVRRLPEPDLRTVHHEVVLKLVAEGAIDRKGALLRLPGHSAKLSDADGLLWRDVESRLSEAGVAAPRLTELAASLGIEADDLAPVLDRIWRIGKLHKAPKGYFLTTQVADELATEVERLAAVEDGLVTVGRLREITGISRHFALPLLEYFDKVGFTRRIARGRRIKQGWREVFPPASP